MISLLLLSHSAKVAEGLKELALEMSPRVNIYSIGGTNTGTTGSDYEKMKDTLDVALKNGSVIILFDLGSTLMTMQMVIEELDEEAQSRVYLSDAALIEGSIVAAIYIDSGLSEEDIIEELKPLSLKKLI